MLTGKPIFGCWFRNLHRGDRGVLTGIAFQQWNNGWMLDDMVLTIRFPLPP